jgi:hypothetical protein
VLLIEMALYSWRHGPGPLIPAGADYGR